MLELQLRNKLEASLLGWCRWWAWAKRVQPRRTACSLSCTRLRDARTWCPVSKCRCINKSNPAGRLRSHQWHQYCTHSGCAHLSLSQSVSVVPMLSRELIRARPARRRRSSDAASADTSPV